MSNKNGGPAFPTDHVDHIPSHPGMSLRDYLAAAALTGLIASSRSEPSFEEYSKCAYHHADAMLAAREKQS